MKLEIDPSGRARCHKCKDLITKGDMRLKVQQGAFQNRPRYKTYCGGCAMNMLDILMDDLYAHKKIQERKKNPTLPSFENYVGEVEP